MDLMHTFATEKTYNNNLKTTNMKKISTILLFVSCSFGFACCQSERCFQETLASIPNNEIKTTNNLLKFSSKEAMYDTISMLLKHTTEEQIAWCKKKNFQSLDMFYQDALDELEKIQNSTNYDIYQKRYHAFREKYTKYFLFNSIDSSDLSPYLATHITAQALIANTDGYIIVEDSLININAVKAFTELEYGKMELAALSSIQTKSDDVYFEEEINKLYIKTAKRKMWAEVEISNNTVYIKYSAHKKGVFGGWNKYKTEYPTRYLDHNSNFWKLGPYFVELIASTTEYVNKGELKSGTKIYLGEVNWVTSGGKATAAFEIYSRGTGAENPGLLEIEVNK